MGSPIEVDYFTDVLCVWAYVSQIRIDELERHYGDRIAVQHRFVSIFGDTTAKIGDGWHDRGGYDGYAQHVRDVCAGFGHVAVHATCWSRCAPRSSGMPHLYLKAVQLSEPARFEDSAWRVRRAFFAEGIDVGRTDELRRLLTEIGLELPPVEARVEDGSAAAALARDATVATSQGVTGSPTFVMNQGRQKLYGNVGYRVLEANVEELLTDPADRASWC